MTNRDQQDSTFQQMLFMQKLGLKTILCLTGLMLPVLVSSVAIAQAGDLPFKTLAVSQRLLPQFQTLDARIEAIQQATVSAETSGRITEVNFDVGDTVREGQVLVRLTSKEQQAGLSASRAAVLEAEARLTEAQNEYQRVENVYGKKLVAKSALDKASADLKAAEQKLKAANASLKSASEKLKYTSVRAPYSGVVVRRLVEIGEAVAPGKPLMEGLSLDKLRVVAQVPQSLQKTLRANPSVVVLDEQRRVSIPITHLALSPRAENGSFLLRGSLPENTPDIFPGMLVKLQFPVGESQQLLLPKAAVVRRSELTAVYVIQDQRVSLRQVRIGHAVDDEVVVLSGLMPGEMVALDPVRAGIYLKESLESQHNSQQNGG